MSAIEVKSYGRCSSESETMVWQGGDSLYIRLAAKLGKLEVRRRKRGMLALHAPHLSYSAVGMVLPTFRDSPQLSLPGNVLRHNERCVS